MTLCLYSVTYFGLTILFFSLLLRILNKGILFGTHLVTILQLLDAISRVACLGFEKSYRESIVLMTRSYLDKVKALGASENNTVPSEATTERTEVCDEFCKKLILHVYLMKCDFDFFSMLHANYAKQHSRLFLQAFCLLLPTSQAQNSGLIIVIGYCLCAQMWG